MERISDKVESIRASELDKGSGENGYVYLSRVLQYLTTIGYNAGEGSHTGKLEGMR
jgi:hypothetical protein